MLDEAQKVEVLKSDGGSRDPGCGIAKNGCIYAQAEELLGFTTAARAGLRRK